MTTIWVRVIYRPRGTQSSMWAYGWVFASDSMSRAWDTLRRVGDWRKWEYRVEKVDPCDFDNPMNRELSPVLDAWPEMPPANPGRQVESRPVFWSQPDAVELMHADFVPLAPDAAVPVDYENEYDK